VNRFWARIGELLRPHAGMLALLASVALSVVGIEAIRTASPPPHPDYATQQLRWLFIAMIATVACALPSVRLVRALAWPLMLLSIALLVLVILPGVPRWLVPMINGATCWINIGFMHVQPSELARVAFILSLALFLRDRTNMRTIAGVLVPLGLMLVPMILIVKEPDLGVALVFPPTVGAMLLAAGARLRHMLALAGLGVLVAALVVLGIYLDLPESMQPLKPHQRARIAALITRAQTDPRPSLRADAYQQEKAVTLVGAGGWSGNGAARAQQIVFHNRLPEDHTDMIYPVIVNRWGFQGAVAVLALYALLFFSLVVTAATSRDSFARLACVGFAGMLAFQTFINVGMTVGLLPVTGITLPFVSYGGASLVMSFVMVGLTCNFASRR
jgi:rod shape determining protein RodA